MKEENEMGRTALAMRGIFFFQSSSAAALSAWLDINTIAYLKWNPNHDGHEYDRVNATRARVSAENSKGGRTRLDGAPLAL